MFSLDAFFLDWRQILVNGKPPENKFDIYNISSLKKAKSDELLIHQDKLIEISKTLSEVGYSRIIIAISPQEIFFDSKERFVNELSNYKNIYLYGGLIRNPDEGFWSEVALRKYPRYLNFTFSRDTRIDNLTRRIIIYYDLQKERHIPDFESVFKLLGIKTKAPDFYKNTFEYLDSIQVYLKIWPSSYLTNIYWENADFKKKPDLKLQDRIAVIGTDGTYGLMSSPSITYRKNIFSDSSIGKNFWPDSQLIVTYLINLTHGEYIKSVPAWVNFLWLYLWMLAVLIPILYLQPPKGIFISALSLIALMTIGCLIFRIFSWDLDFSRGVVGSILAQYILTPIVFLRKVRRLDSEKLQAEKEREADRVKSRFIIKAARADLSLQMAARVSHDIRSPLMALQVAQSVIKGKISEDLESLIRESILRLKFIADDILENYRNGKSVPANTEKVVLKDLIEDLLKSYRQIHSEVKFTFEISEDIWTFIPQYSLQRCLSNLLNNSIESLAGPGGEVLVQAIKLGDQIEIKVRDNGCGVPIEIRSRLFQERASFGKKSGTGLGLFQIRKELENYGGKIVFEEQALGSCFVILLPNAISRVPLTVSTNILIVETSKEIYSALNFSENKDFKIIQQSSVLGACDAMAELNSKIPWTIFVDLSLSDEESGFDLLEKLGAKFSGKIIICSAFADNVEVQQMAQRYNALLLNKDLLPRLELQAGSIDLKQ